MSWYEIVPVRTRPPGQPGPREQIADLEARAAVLEAENRALRERIERLERQFDAAMVPLPVE